MMEIYLGDLREDVQQEVLKVLGYKSAKESNLDIEPLFILEEPES
jgi:hypothetical protein